MHALFFLKHSKAGDEELRLALRGIAKNAPWIEKVWVFGDRPHFLSEERAVIEHVPHESVARVGNFKRKRGPFWFFRKSRMSPFPPPPFPPPGSGGCDLAMKEDNTPDVSMTDRTWGLRGPTMQLNYKFNESCANAVMHQETYRPEHYGRPGSNVEFPLSSHFYIVDLAPLESAQDPISDAIDNGTGAQVVANINSLSVEAEYPAVGTYDVKWVSTIGTMKWALYESANIITLDDDDIPYDETVWSIPGMVGEVIKKGEQVVEGVPQGIDDYGSTVKEVHPHGSKILTGQVNYSSILTRRQDGQWLWERYLRWTYDAPGSTGPAVNLIQPITSRIILTAQFLPPS